MQNEIPRKDYRSHLSVVEEKPAVILYKRHGLPGNAAETPTIAQQEYEAMLKKIPSFKIELADISLNAVKQEDQ